MWSIGKGILWLLDGFFDIIDKIWRYKFFDNEYVNKIYRLLRELSLGSNNEWCCYFLFKYYKNDIRKTNELENNSEVRENQIKCILENYAVQYEIAIENYEKKKDGISILLG